MPVCRNIEILQGESWALFANYRDAAQALINLSAYEGQMDIRRSPRDADPILSLTTSNGGVILSATEFNIHLRISRTQTNALPTNNREIHDWDYSFKLWQISDPEYTTRVLLKGEVSVTPSITRVPV
jgi:hypothetical protein